MTGRTMAVIGVAAALALAACGSDSTSGAATNGAGTTTKTTSDRNYGSGTTAAPSTTAPSTTAPSTTAPASSGPSLKVLAGTARGDVLTDGDGKAVYLFGKDQGTTSACSGGCLDAWPPFKADAAPAAAAGVDATKLGTSNGQVTYNGHLLYYFSGDAAPGDLKGADIPSWYAVTPAGVPAESK
jgi:predicted lipoprotein with Yx(FWY)xxD motif